MIPFFFTYLRTKNLWGVRKWSYHPSSLTQRVSVVVTLEANADRCGWAWPWCFVTCVFSTVYCWNWSWRCCSFPRKWAGAHEGSPSCCTLEEGWENRKWVQEWRLPRWRKVWWPRWTHRTVEPRRRVVCGWEEGLHRVRGWRHWGTWWPDDLRDPAESDSWWESPH